MVLVLNPIYTDILDEAFELILRANFSILIHKEVTFDEDQVEDCFGRKFNPAINMQGNQLLESLIG